MKWWWRRSNGHDSAEILEQAKRQEKLTRKMTPAIEAYAEALRSELTAEEFAARVANAFRRPA